MFILYLYFLYLIMPFCLKEAASLQEESGKLSRS